MKKTILVLSWVTTLVVGLSIFSVWFSRDQLKKNNASRDNHIKELGLACIHHVHNLQNPADANKKSFYGIGLQSVDAYVADAMLECFQRYPLYSEQAHFSPYNTTTN